MDGYKKREAGRWVSVSLSVGVVAVGSGCLLVGGQLPEWRKVLQCWVYEVNGHAEHLGDGLHHVDGYGILASLDEVDVGALQSCLLCQLLLGQSPQSAQGGYAATDALSIPGMEFDAVQT